MVTMADLDANPWASCGPASLAALLNRPLADIRHAFPNQREGRTWTNLQQMMSAVGVLGCRMGAPPWHGEAGRAVFDWPQCGLALVQFCGSWDSMPIKHPAQLARTHWVAAAPVGYKVGDLCLAKPGAFDINLVGDGPDEHGWVSLDGWKSAVAPMLAKAHGKRATGKWWLRGGIEVKS